MYNLTDSSVQKSSQNYAQQSIRKNKYKVVLGWNKRVKAKHSVAREKYLD